MKDPGNKDIWGKLVSSNEAYVVPERRASRRKEFVCLIT